MRTAALVSDDVREIEKYGDNVTRKPHYNDGSHLIKKKLIEILSFYDCFYIHLKGPDEPGHDGNCHLKQQ
jgi:2,3-bisphosphoglycerate-independent phosphoglycerate mutase